MTKTIAQIQYEMETVKLIKSALDVNGNKAYELFKEWTTKKEDKGLVAKNEHGKTVLEIKSNGEVNLGECQWNTSEALCGVNEILNKEFDIAKDIIGGSDVFAKAQESAEHFSKSLIETLESYIEFAKQENK